MNLIAEFWYIWLAILIATFIYGICNQIARMKRMSDYTDIAIVPEEVSDSFFRGMISFFIAGIISATCGMLLVIAVIIHIIDYTQQ